jgi:DNA-binding MarR family transcriptional regulator
MMANTQPLASVLRPWRQIYQTASVLKQHEDQMLKQYGLTVEKLGVLTVIAYLGGTARVTDIAGWLERSSNSVSMIVDRMVKAGLVRRKRDKVDRRVVYVSATGKGEDAFRRAYPAMIEFIRRFLQPLSHEEMSTVSDLLGTLKYELLKSSNPAVDVKELKRIDSEKLAGTERWINKSRLLSVPEADDRREARSKAARRIR